MAEMHIAELIDQLAADPSPRTFASIKSSTGCKVDIDYRQFLSLVNTAALWLDKHLCPDGHSKTFAYMGTKDLCRMTLLVACAKSGWRILMVRRYASEAAMKHLVGASDCSTFLYDNKESCSEVRDRLEIQYPDNSHIMLPQWESWLSISERVDYMARKSYKQSMDDPVCVYHTSGTTGTPKPIVWTNRRIASVATLSYLQQEMGLAGQNLVCTFPSSHLGGALFSLFLCVYLDMISVLPENTVPVTPEDVFDLLEDGKGDILVAQPSVLAAMANSEQYLRRMRNLAYIFTGSAPMSKADVDVLQAEGGPLVVNFYGATETMPLPSNVPGRDEWPYLSWRPEAGVRFRHEQDNLYELVIDKLPEANLTQAVFTTFTDIQSFPSRDLFAPHPDKQGVWRFCGRKDDMLSLASGQGINVGPMERAIMECPLVDTAIVGGDGRPTSILLVIPHPQSSLTPGMLRAPNALWSFIEQANDLCHAAGAIRRHMVLVLPTRDHLTSISEKGSVNRQQTLSDFQGQIDAVYHTASATEMSQSY